MSTTPNLKLPNSSETHMSKWGLTLKRGRSAGIYVKGRCLLLVREMVFISVFDGADSSRLFRIQYLGSESSLLRSQVVVTEYFWAESYS